MGLPHLVLLMLISFMLGKGVKGVTIAVALTHWPSLTRIVRSEVMQIRSSQYVQAAYKMGISKWKSGSYSYCSTCVAILFDWFSVIVSSCDYA